MALTPEIDDPNRDAELERLGLKPVQTVDDTWAAYLKQSVAAIVDQLAELDDEQLAALREAEVLDKNRSSLINAIDNELSERGE